MAASRAARRRAVPLILALAVAVTAGACTVRQPATPTPPASLPPSAQPSAQPSASVVAPSGAQPYVPYAGTQPALTPTGATTQADLLTADGRTRQYRLYVPPRIAPGATVPLLVALHGGLGSAAQFEANSGFDGLAEANGFIVVYPDGIPALPGTDAAQTWNGGSCCGAAAQRNVEDVGFVRQLVDALAVRLPVDRRRIVMAGHSNGAIMAYRLACELADRIVAIGLQAGSLGVPGCAPTRPVGLFHLHGLADTNVPFSGGQGTGVSGASFRPARESVDTLAQAAACPGGPQPSEAPDNRDLAVLTWAGCAGGASIRLVTVAGAGHAWMGHPSTSRAAATLVGEPYADLDASRAIWSFLSTQVRQPG